MVERQFGLGEELVPQELLGNVVNTPTRIERKWDLKVWIMHSAMLRRCMSGGTNLEGCLPFLFNLQFVGDATFVVKDLEVDGVTVFLEAGH